MYLRLSLLQLLQWAVPGSLVPLYSYHLESLRFDKLTIAYCCATQAVSGVIASLLAGQIADRWVSAERAMAVCALLAGLDLWWLSTLSDPNSIFVATLLFWMLCGPLTLLGTTVCFAHLSHPERQFGPIRMWGTVGWIAITWAAAGFLRLGGEAVPLSVTFRLGSVVAWCLAVYTLTLPATPPRHPTRSARWFAPAAALGLLADRGFLVYALCLFGASLTFPFTTQTTPLLLGELGVQREALPLALSAAQPTEVVGLFLLPLLLGGLGLRWTMLLGLAAWLLAMLVLNLGRPVELVVTSLTLNGLFITCFMVAGQVYVNGLAAGDLKASVQGLFNCVNGLGILLGNVLAGAMREVMGNRLAATFAVSAVITALMLVLFAAAFRPRRAA